MLDPSGQKGFWSWLIDIFAIVVDILSEGAFTGEMGFIMAGAHGIHVGLEISHIAMEIAPFANAAAAVANISGIGGSPGSQFQKQTPTPKGYFPCPPVWFKITGIGPNQAKGKGAGVNRTPQEGDVAYNPKNFGLDTADAHALDRSDHPILFQPDWSTAQIPGKHGRGTVQPGPGMPQVPDGLPVNTDQTLEGRDTIGGLNRAANRNRLDLYRYDTQDAAKASLRRVKVTALIPIDSGATCPK